MFLITDVPFNIAYLRVLVWTAAACRTGLRFGTFSNISLSRSLGTNRDNSVSIVTMLRDRRIVCHLRQSQKILPFVEKCSALYTAICITSTGGFPRGKIATNDWSYTSAPPFVFMSCIWQIYPDRYDSSVMMMMMFLCDTLWKSG
jgi:hypothetical protein